MTPPLTSNTGRSFERDWSRQVKPAVLASVGRISLPTLANTAGFTWRDQSRSNDLPVLLVRGGVISQFTNSSDEELMALYQQGKYDAFEELYLRHSGRVY